MQPEIDISFSKNSIQDTTPNLKNAAHSISNYIKACIKYKTNKKSFNVFVKLDQLIQPNFNIQLVKVTFNFLIQITYCSCLYAQKSREAIAYNTSGVYFNHFNSSSILWQNIYPCLQMNFIIQSFLYLERSPRSIRTTFRRRTKLTYKRTQQSHYTSPRQHV